MKWLFSTILIFLCLTSFGRRFYVGSGGNNNNSGLTIGLRWLDLTKVNSVNFIAGDSILFQGGEDFVGQFKPTASSNNFTISSYGSGKATFSGLTTISGWSNISGQIWEATPSQTLKANCNVLTVNGYPQAVGRYPNVGQYLIYQTANTTTVTSNALTGTPNYTGAEVVFKNNGYSATKGAITGQSGNVLTYTFTQAIDNGSPVTSSPVMPTGGNFGFFLQRFANSLDQQWEWYFNKATNKMRIYSTVNPSTLTIKASYQDTLFFLGNHTNINITNVAFEGAGMYAIETFNGANIRVDSCVFTNNTRPIYAWGPLNMTVDSCTFRHSFVNAIMINGSSTRYPKQITITNNSLDSTGKLLGMGVYWSDFNMKGMYARVDVSTTSNFLNIIGNTLTNTGYSGIQFQGSNVTVKKNVIRTYLGNLQDGGGIYTFTNNQSLNTINYVNRVVDSNFISNSLNGAWGVGNDLTPDLAGYYLDDQATNISGTGNVIWDVPANPVIVANGGTGVAIQMNTPHDNIFTNNTIYNCNYFMDLNKRHVAEVYNNRITKNVMYQKQNTLQLYFLHVDDNLNLPTPHTITEGIQDIAFIDSNWISNQLSNGFKYYYSPPGVTGPIFFNLAAWKATYLHDINAVLPPIALTNTNTNLYTNPSNNLLTINFAGFRKIDPKGVIYDNQATVGRWSGLVLIDNGNSSTGGNIPPTINAGVDKLITAPVTTTSATATSTLGSGTSITYLWTELSGPNTAVISHPTMLSTNFNGLVPGIYQMRIRGLNNLGDSAVDFMQITVQAANQPPTSNPGSAQTIQLPQNSTTVSGNASTDPENLPLTYHWTYQSGPSGSTINSPNNAITLITNLVAGVYQFNLTVTDQGGLTNTATIQITVLAIVPPVNQPPVANAGPNQAFSLPQSTTNLDASGSTDPEGGALTYSWRKLSGSPAGGNIVGSTTVNPTVNSLVQGLYFFQVTVKDPLLDSSVAVVRITVTAAPQAPTVNAGNDTAITLPISAVNLVATANDPQGSTLTIGWVKLSGPAGGTIATPTSLSTAINSLAQGVYIYELTVTNTFGLSSKDAVQITVNPKPTVPPVADAGIGQTILTPQTTTNLNGSATDQDGTINSYGWVQVSGPNSAILTPNNTASIVVSNLIVGTYQFALTATDNDDLTGKDTVQIDVQDPPPPILPVASAGGNFTTFNTSITLNGSGSDQGGTIVSYSWVILSQPAGSNTIIANTNSAMTTVSGLIVGEYQFQITVTDNDGNMATDIAIVSVETPTSVLLRFYRVFP